MRSVAAEDTLKAVLAMEQAAVAASTGALAARLGIRPASVTGMLQRLARKRLVRYRPYQPVRLTARGRRTALRLLRRHRLIELFLVETLGLPWDKVHGEAERWEHVVSDEVIDLMDAALGHPTRDPHGSPIPSADGQITPPRARPLSELAAGQSATIVEIPDRDPALVRHFEALGLRPDVRLEVLAVEPFGGVLTLRVPQGTCTLSRAAAAGVNVGEIGNGGSQCSDP